MARSLLGKADPTLVQGSFREATANIPLNRGPIYATQVENVKMFQDTIQKAYNMQFADYINTNDELKTASKEIMSSIQSGTYTDDESVSLYTNAISDLKSRLKQIPKGKKGDLDRAKVRGELSRMKNSATNAEEVLSKIYTMINNDQHNVAGTGEMLPLFNAIAQGNAKREVVNGELVYSIPTQDGEVKLNHNQLAEKLVLKDYKADANVLKLTKSYVDEGKIQGNVFDPQDAAGLYEKLITSKNSYAHLINESHGMKHSFAEAFNGKDANVMAQINTILKDYGGDIDNDGKPDQITKDNASKFIDALTNIHSKNFNFTAAKKIASMYYAEKLARPEYERGQGILNAATASKNKNKKDSGTKTIEYGGFEYNTNSTGFDDTHPDESKRSRALNIGYVQMMQNRNSLLPKNVVKGSEIPGEHYVYKFNGETWQAFYNNEFVKNVKGSQIAQWEGLLSSTDIQQGRGLPMFNTGTSSAKQAVKEELRKPLTPGGIGIGAIESNNVNDVRRSIQDIFIAQFAKDFKIEPLTKEEFGMNTTITRKVPNKIKITGPDRFEKVYQIGKKATNELADQITKDILGVDDYRKQDPLNPNN
tara:strand:+ start:2896 stop:4671 length:1776 start_codon:yes stop_codon:yes gene_type:complete